MVLKDTKGEAEFLCDECTAADWLLANGTTKTGQAAFRNGVRIGIAAQWDPDLELKGMLSTAKRRGRPPKKRGQNEDQCRNVDRANSESERAGEDLRSASVNGGLENLGTKDSDDGTRMEHRPSSGSERIGQIDDSKPFVPGKRECEDSLE